MRQTVFMYIYTLHGLIFVVSEFMWNTVFGVCTGSIFLWNCSLFLFHENVLVPRLDCMVELVPFTSQS